MLKEKFGINCASAEAQFGTGRGIRLEIQKSFRLLDTLNLILEPCPKALCKSQFPVPMEGITEEVEPLITSSESEKSSIEEKRTLREILEQDLIHPSRLGKIHLS